MLAPPFEAWSVPREETCGRRLGAADRGGDLAVGKVGDAPEHDRGALSLRQLLDRAPQLLIALGGMAVRAVIQRLGSATGVARRARGRCVSIALRAAIVSTQARRLESVLRRG